MKLLKIVVVAVVGFAFGYGVSNLQSKAPCICGNECKCKDGCPKKCPVLK